MIKNIVLTGGACSGKTSSLNEIKNYFQDYNVFLVPEVASLIIKDNINMGKLSKDEMLLIDAEILKFKQQFYESYNQLAKVNNEKSIIVYDRAELDGMVYNDKDSFISLLNQFNLDVNKIYSQYDTVIHLQSLAVDKPELYNNDNPTRWENIEQAAFFDKELVEVWKGHHNYHLLDNTNDFNHKLDVLVNIIENELR